MEYPYDEDEEYNMAYADEMELMMEMEEECAASDLGQRPKSKRSLDFSSPPLKPVQKNVSTEVPILSTAPTNGDTESRTLPMEVEAQHFEGPDRKRKVEELFGDIDDIEDDDLCSNLNLKKTKQTELSNSEEMIIEKITAGRQKAQNERKTCKILGSTQKSLCSDEVKQPSISRSVPRWAFITVTTSDSDRFYIRLKSEDAYSKEIESIGCKGRTIGLLSVSFETVREQARLYIQKKLDQEEANEFERKIRALEDSGMDSGVELTSEDEKEDSADLWVERYKPKTYIELLSDESTNRTLLHWLKLWDKVVFNRETKTKRKHKEENKTKKPFSENRFQKKIVQEKSFDDLDENGCPQYKMALLCGPPGLGKTTLAHMVARHAGYKVVEMNASDDRSPDIFRNQLEAATQMRAVMGEEPRPNCLVLDEIDGAPAASIEVLVKFATGKDVGKKRAKKKATPTFLKRPIICICNDVYVPALRPLRQLAFVIHFPPTASARLAQRLLEICRKQRIKTNMGALTALAEKTRNDVRACLSFLHFFKMEKKEIRLSDVQKSNVGLKDMQKGLFTVWQEIFQIQRPKRKFVETNKDDYKLEPMPELTTPEMKFGETSKASRMRSILQTVQSHGDYERLAQGVFENYLNMNLKEGYAQLKQITDSLEWFCTLDVFSHHIHATQNYVLMSYLPYAFAFWHFTFALSSWPKITYPNAGYEASVKEARTRQLVSEMMRGMDVKVRAHYKADTLLMDTLPHLLRIIVPRVRPVNIQLYSKSEKQELDNVIGIMIDYNLNYVQERTPVGAYEYNLDPNMAEVAHFPDTKPNRTLSYNAKQLIARELEMEKLRRAEASLLAAQPTDKDKTKDKGKGKDKDKAVDKTKEAPAVPNHLQSLKPKAISEVSRVVKDFFGREVEQVASSRGAGRRIDEIVKSDIWFHFKEGFSNAVRKTIKMKDLA
ncbi:chromosome transmission fidelity protein 18 homolog isoform X2 [Schistocerca gregaria]|uniref:chromosome transmission fidelity protein 18 homolog isoform X2 n=1 Tax=Schistocerca gregaria TaxID=7010 RepID=UPI00211DCC80|nr:chromosome transmission fidelity protein 18 homolog isoform X2 [Schistocerca gregaria]